MPLEPQSSFDVMGHGPAGEWDLRALSSGIRKEWVRPNDDGRGDEHEAP
jgi:hypothetical protein